ncbi:MAG: DoxX [Verrucomicrobiaceae bacterium]|nr:DoxX [Verrucomicrobiaceae bacterium]
MSDQSCRSKCSFEWASAHLILRVWVGARLLFAGLDKMREKGGSGFGLDFIPKSMAPIKDNMAQYSLMPKPAVEMYAGMLPYALLAVGAWVIVGLFTRLSLLAAGLLFLSLSFGLMSLPDDDQAVQRGIEVAITAFALVTSSAYMFSLDGLFFRNKPSAE